jgi:hypothetical protein
VPHPTLSRRTAAAPSIDEANAMEYLESARAQDDLFPLVGSLTSLHSSMSTMFIPADADEGPSSADAELESLYQMSHRVLNASERLVQHLWRRFLHPDPWVVLTTSCISDVCAFAQAFVPAAFSQHQRARWAVEDFGLCSGLAELLYYVCDRAGSGRITFEDYLEAIGTFTCGTISQKLRLCFSLFDIGAKGRVLYEDLVCCFIIVNSVFQGSGDNQQQALEQSRMYADLICDRADDLMAQLAAEAMVAVMHADPAARPPAQPLGQWQGWPGSASPRSAASGTASDAGSDVPLAIVPLAVASSASASAPLPPMSPPTSPAAAAAAMLARASRPNAAAGDDDADADETDWSGVECPCTCDDCLECNLYIQMKRHAMALMGGPAPEAPDADAEAAPEAEAAVVSSGPSGDDCLCSHMCRDRILGWGSGAATVPAPEPSEGPSQCPSTSASLLEGWIGDDSFTSRIQARAQTDEDQSLPSSQSARDCYSFIHRGLPSPVSSARPSVDVPSELSVPGSPISVSPALSRSPNPRAAEALPSRIEFPVSVKERGLTYYEFCIHIPFHPLTALLFGIKPIVDY